MDNPNMRRLYETLVAYKWEEAREEIRFQVHPSVEEALVAAAELGGPNA